MTRICLLFFLLAATALGQTNVRGWYADGQVWIVWEDGAVIPNSYEIWRSDTDFLTSGDVSGGSRVGRLLPIDWKANRLQRIAPMGTTLTFTIPDGAGGTYTLATNEGAFAYTPHAADSTWWTVVAEGDTTVTAANSVGPIAEQVGTVEAHLQHLGTINGQSVRVYAHWIDGRDDHTATNGNYPVMGNAGFNGTTGLFCVSDPVSGPPAAPVPAVVALHGGGGNYQNFLPGRSPNIGLDFQTALLITIDGALSTASGEHAHSFFGYPATYDRFSPVMLQPVPDGTIVVDYTARRVSWELDWIAAHEPVDTDALSILGHSDGSRAAGMLSRREPERFAACNIYSALLEPAPTSPFTGDASQNLPTTLPGNPGILELYDEARILDPTVRDHCPTRVVIGRMDMTATATWNAQQVQAFEALYAAGRGHQLYWDTRDHGTNTWVGAYFNGSTMLMGETLTAHRVDRSYPGFSNDDLDPSTPGRQPDIGDGNPLVGDTNGTWSGYYTWNTATITDSATEWACTFWLNGLSPVPQDNFPGSSAVCDVSIRRPQAFLPAEGVGLQWGLTLISTGAILQQGTEVVGADGLVTIRDLEVFPDPARVRLTIRPCPPTNLYPGTGEDLVLRTGVNGAATSCHVKFALPGDGLTIEMVSPAGTFDPYPPVLLGQFFVTGAAAPIVPAFPEIHLDPAGSPGPYILLDGLAGPFGPLSLPTDGLVLGPYVVGPALAGVSTILQGFSLTGTAANGFAATTDAHEVRFMP